MDRTTGLGPAILLAFVAPFLWGGNGASADAIDGNWCYGDGRHMSIEGAEIVTPAGTVTRGTYDRHSFSYNTPDADPNSGSVVSIVLVNNETVNLRTEPNSQGVAEVWHRCDFVS